MKDYAVTLDHIALAWANGRLSIAQALDCAHAMGRTGIPEEHYEALGITG